MSRWFSQANMVRKAVTASLILCLGTTGAMADYGGGSDESGNDTNLNRSTTREVVRILRGGHDRCEREKKIYKWDCYRLVYREAKRKIRDNTAYDEVEEAMELIEDAIDAAVTKNIDPAQPNRRRLVQTYRPVKPEAIPEIKRETIRAMEQAETILLRAPEHKVRHMGQIAEAVNSNKVLLRSALLLLPAPLQTGLRMATLYIWNRDPFGTPI